MKRRIIRKNRKRIDPRYFLHERLDDEGFTGEPTAATETEPVAVMGQSDPAAPEGEAPAEDTQIEWSDRQEWTSAKGLSADETTDENHEELGSALGAEYNVIDPFDVEQLRQITMDEDEKDIVPLGAAEGYIWFKTGDHKYGKLKLKQAVDAGLAL